MALDEWVNTSSVRHIPPGQLVDYITGKLRRETPEEHVRQRVARSLVEEYGYSRKQIKLDFRIFIGSKKHPVDIAIFQENKHYKQEHIYIIIETKKEAVKPTSKDQGIGQLNSYIGASLNCEFGMWTNGVDKYCYQKKKTNGQFEISEIVDIPPKGKSLEDYEKLDFKELRPATELKSVFRRCHDYIYGNQGLPKDMAFHELLKVIFCKVHDEKESTKVRFYVTSKELKTPIGQINVKERMDELFYEVKKRYPHIFRDPDEKIELYNKVLAYIVGQLQHFSLVLTDTDVKGAAYEAIVGANLRGDRGEFFTPRNVCKMAVESLFNAYPQEQWHNLRVIDPACGTGGFLIEVINFLDHHFRNEERNKWTDETQAIKQADERLKRYCEQSLYGIDLNQLLVRASQMNEVMHGNGSGNLFQENSLIHPGEWKEKTRKNLKLETFDLLFTNPPFGSKIPIDDPHTLEQYDLAYIWQKNKEQFARTEKLQKSVPPEQLFIERCIQLLKPGGKLAIVLPDSILNNPGLAYIRYWILRKTRVIASIDLSRDAFQPYVGTKTSVLFLEKKSKEEILIEERSGKPETYEVYMAIADKIGHDRRGNTVFKRTPEGEKLIVQKEKEIVGIVGKKKYKEKLKVSEPIVEDDLPSITTSFKEWLQKE